MSKLSLDAPRSNSPEALCGWAFRFAVLAFMTALLGVAQANGIVPSLATAKAASVEGNP